MSITLEFALRYAEAGHKIIPLHNCISGKCSCGKPNCKAPGKHPHIPQWPELATVDPSTINQWWTQWPDANIGMPLDGLVAVDIDPRNNGDANLDILLDKHGQLPHTWTQRTGGGGLHYVFRANGGTYGKAIVAGVDLKFGKAQYICVEPSVHQSGNGYFWQDEEGPIDGGEPAMAPHWLETPEPQSIQASRAQDAEDLNEVALRRLDDWVPALFPQAKLHSGGIYRITSKSLGRNLEEDLSIAPNGIQDFGEERGLTPLGVVIEFGNVGNASESAKWLRKTLGLGAYKQNGENKRVQIDTNITVAPNSLTFGNLLDKKMDDIMHFSKPWISEGVTLLAGRPKIGKTTLARQLAICLGEGKSFLDSETKKSNVLFISLEENERIFRRKLQIMGCSNTLHSCIVFFEWPRGKDGASYLGEYLTKHPDIEVVIIDSLTRIRDLPTADRNVFMQDYEAMRMFHTIMSAHTGKSLVMLHQTRKGKADDPIEDISGSFGLTAACDSYFVFRTEKDGKYVLHAGGRLWDSDSSAFELDRSGNIWVLVKSLSASDLTDRSLTDAQQEVHEYLTKTGGMTPSELGSALKISKQAASYRLNGLIRKDKAKTEKGVYYAI